jgi:hypothetical protein
MTNENFGTFSFQRQLSGKQLLPRISLRVVPGRKAQWQVGKFKFADGALRRY